MASSRPIRAKFQDLRSQEARKLWEKFKNGRRKSFVPSLSPRKITLLLFVKSCTKTDVKHCVQSTQIRSFFWSAFSCIRIKYGDFTEQISILGRNTGKYEPEKTPYLDTFHAVRVFLSGLFSLIFPHCFVNFVVDCRWHSWRIFFREIDGVAYT